MMRQARGSGTDYDDVQSIGAKRHIGIGRFLSSYVDRTDELDFQVTLDTLANRINSIRGELVVDGITGTSHEVGLQVRSRLGGKLLFRYGAGVRDGCGIGGGRKSKAAYVNQTNKTYQSADVIGVVATSPGIVLGDQDTNGYPIAFWSVQCAGQSKPTLTGQILYAGDRLDIPHRVRATPCAPPKPAES